MAFDGTLSTAVRFSQGTSLVTMMCTSFVALLFAGRIIYNIYLHPLRQYPGPRALAATFLPYCYHQVHGDLPRYVATLHARFGPVVRVAPDQLAYTTAGAWQDIYGQRTGLGQLPKDPNSLPARPDGIPTGIINSDDSDHSRYRRLLAHAFSMKALEEQQPLIMSYVDLLVRRLAEESSNGSSTQDMVAWYNWTTFDLIGDLTFGEPFGCLEDQHYHPWITRLFNNIRVGLYIQVLRRFGLDRLLLYILPKDMVKQRMAHWEHVRAKVSSRLARGPERPDFMSCILRNRGKEGELSEEEMIPNASSLIIAGSETTATLLSGATYHLLKNPKILQKVVDEVRLAFKNNVDIDLASCGRLNYLLAVLNESLRIYPPVPTAIPRVITNRDGEMIDGGWVPKNTIVGVYQWAACRSPENFLKPDCFIPERWLGDPEFRSDKKDSIQPFSVGPRNCLGKNLAYAEMRLILAKILWHFDLELQNVKDDWVLSQRIFGFWEKKPLMVRLKVAR